MQRCVVEQLEPRRLLAGNFAALGLSLLDFADNTPTADPPAGTQVRVRATFRAEGIAAGTVVRLLRDVNPGSRYVEVTADASWLAGTTVEKEITSWAVPPGTRSMTLVVDDTNAIAETNESDNRFTLTIRAGDYTPATLAVQAYHSLPGASYALYLDFDGHYQANWLNYRDVVTPVFDLDRDAPTLSANEREAIHTIWASVAEDFAPFNLDVTTEAPSPNEYIKYQRVVVGGTTSDWVGGNEGGIAPLGTFSTSQWQVPGYAFTSGYYDNTIATPGQIASIVSHEAGHTFGLSHQSRFENGVLTETYRKEEDGDSPLMGNGYTEPATWDRGPSESGEIQDDLDLLSSNVNGFGYRPDDHGSTIGQATVLGNVATSPTLAGIVGRNSDVDFFNFTVPSPARIQVDVSAANIAPNIDVALMLFDATGTLIEQQNPDGSQGARVTRTLATGQYYASVASSGKYGRIGQYLLSASVAVSTPRVQIVDPAGATVSLDTPGFYDLGVTSSGSVAEGRYRITNTGAATLRLNAPTASAGFSATVGQTALATGESTDLLIVATPAQGGLQSGTVTLTSNDPTHATLALPVSVVVRTPSLPDLVATEITSATSAVRAGAKVKVRYKIANTGEARLKANVTTRLLLSTDPTPSDDDITLTTKTSKLDLKIGRSKSKRLSVTIPITTADGVFHILAVIDPAQLLNDTDRTNNVLASSPLAITAIHRDITLLAGTPVVWRGSTASTKVSFLVKNIGNVRVKGRVQYDCFLSGDAVISDDDAPINTSVKTESLDAGRQKKRTLSLGKIAIPPGDYFVIVRATAISGFSDEAIIAFGVTV